ncbi:unnamed protein product [Heligmosomoides polygyrus]|uniref:Uncharacterized protein n=1 Tax=Heligmosomoides polygyrus TaxID=6339 RepID=A0A3P8ALR2_HELPZ|nr:unnamed protein product [Heligmosomoides polygyrus]
MTLSVPECTEMNRTRIASQRKMSLGSAPLLANGGRTPPPSRRTSIAGTIRTLAITARRNSSPLSRKSTKKMKKSRLVGKNGICNVYNTNVPKKDRQYLRFSVLVVLSNTDLLKDSINSSCPICLSDNKLYKGDEAFFVSLLLIQETLYFTHFGHLCTHRETCHEISCFFLFYVPSKPISLSQIFIPPLFAFIWSFRFSRTCFAFRILHYITGFLCLCCCDAETVRRKASNNLQFYSS